MNRAQLASGMAEKLKQHDERARWETVPIECASCTWWCRDRYGHPGQNKALVFGGARSVLGAVFCFLYLDLDEIGCDGIVFFFFLFFFRASYLFIGRVGVVGKVSQRKNTMVAVFRVVGTAVTRFFYSTNISIRIYVPRCPS